MIKINNLEKFYNKGKKNEQYVLKGISLEFADKGLVCILGESGSGKTTLLNTVSGIDTFSAGSIDIDGKKIVKYDPKIIEPVRNEKFDYIFQNYYLLKDYSVEYNVKIALNRYDMTEEEKDERTKYVLGMLGMERYKNKEVSKLSGGQQQRVSIARALVKSPDVIFADEPTGNLDEENTLKTMSILKSISKECLVILVTHEKRIADFFADRIIEVEDGQISADYENNADAEYERSQDTNIYLKEYKSRNLSIDSAQIDTYYDEEDADKEIELTVAWRDGKLYVKNEMDCDIIIEGIENGVRMINDHKPVMNMDQLKDFSFELPKLQGKADSKLPFREAVNMALKNLRLMGKNQIFIIIIMALTSVVLTITLAEFFNSIFLDEKSVIKTDSHYVKVNLKNSTSFRGWYSFEDEAELVEKYSHDSNYGKSMYIPQIFVYTKGKGYKQMVNLTSGISNFSFADINFVKKEDLLYGRMPENIKEIVVDKQLLERLSRSKASIFSSKASVESYLDTSFFVKGSSAEHELKVVGIANLDEPDIYCEQNLLVGVALKDSPITNLEQIKKLLPDDFKNIDKLKDDEVILPERSKQMVEGGLYNLASGYSDQTEEVKVVAYMPDELGIGLVASDARCESFRTAAFVKDSNIFFYTDDYKKSFENFNKGSKKETFGKKISISNPSVEEVNEYKKKHSGNLVTLVVIPLVIFLVSMVIIYFTIKSNAVTRMEELTVYRLLGISKSSILQAFMIEMVIMTSYTVLPCILITTIVLNFFSSVPSVDLGMSVPVWASLCLIVFMYFVNAIISTFPVSGILSKPPASLALKE